MILELTDISELEKTAFGELWVSKDKDWSTWTLRLGTLTGTVEGKGLDYSWSGRAYFLVLKLEPLSYQLWASEN